MWWAYNPTVAVFNFSPIKTYPNLNVQWSRIISIPFQLTNQLYTIKQHDSKARLEKLRYSTKGIEVFCCVPRSLLAKMWSLVKRARNEMIFDAKCSQYEYSLFQREQIICKQGKFRDYLYDLWTFAKMKNISIKIMQISHVWPPFVVHKGLVSFVEYSRLLKYATVLYPINLLKRKHSA